MTDSESASMIRSGRGAPSVKRFMTSWWCELGEGATIQGCCAIVSHSAARSSSARDAARLTR